VPAGALGTNTTITITPADPPADGAVGTVYEIGPTGTQFSVPVTLTLSYADLDLGGASESSLRVATYGAGGWQILAGASIDTAHKTVSGLTSHLSPYTLILEDSGAVCATFSLRPFCSGGATTNSGSAGGSAAPDSGTGGAPSGSSASSGSAGAGASGPSCTTPTCDDAMSLCDGYPGSVPDCSANATGATGTCCFAPGSPICFAAAAASTCASGGTSINGVGSSCPPPPTCASPGDACGAYPGAKLENCSDGPSGLTGACCFDPGAAICVKHSVAASCGGTSQGSAGGGAGGAAPSCPTTHCADADPCAGLPGTTAQGCTDNDYGFDATCCYTIGTLPPSDASVTGTGGPANTGGASSGDGTAGSSMFSGTGGAPNAGGGGADSSGAGMGAGGVPNSGGVPNGGGAANSGSFNAGASGTGAAPSSGGADSSGAGMSGGAPDSGGVPNSGGTPSGGSSSAGTSGTGAAPSSGGADSSGAGMGGVPNGGSGGSGGSSGAMFGTGGTGATSGSSGSSSAGMSAGGAPAQ
jgi:hypothetical protein